MAGTAEALTVTCPSIIAAESLADLIDGYCRLVNNTRTSLWNTKGRNGRESIGILCPFPCFFVFFFFFFFSLFFFYTNGKTDMMCLCVYVKRFVLFKEDFVDISSFCYILDDMLIFSCFAYKFPKLKLDGFKASRFFYFLDRETER